MEVIVAVETVTIARSWYLRRQALSIAEGLQLCGAISWGVQGVAIDMDRSVAVHCLWHAFHMQTLCGELTSRCISSFCSPPVLGSNVVAKRMCMSTLESGIYPRKERLEVRSHVI